MLATNLVLLYEILSNKKAIINKPFAILFNKLDLVGDLSNISIVSNTLRIDDLLHRNNDWKDNLILLSGSSISDECSSDGGEECSFHCVKEWILSFLEGK